MILDALKSMGQGMDLNFQMPKGEPTKKDMTNSLAETVKDWSSMDWDKFGKDLGQLMQEAVVKKFPQKYSVEGSLLRNQLLRSQGGGSSVMTLLPTMLFLASVLIAVK